MTTLDEARAAKRGLRAAVSGIGGVVGIGVAPEFSSPIESERPAPGGVRLQQVPAPGVGRVNVLAQQVAVDDLPSSDGGWVLQVNVVDPAVVDKIPEEIGDVSVRVRVVGAVRAG
ncbi:hypothetical protein [Myceligenerans pegani]|uniref:Uncharacterized protein n=1 Tax=Myceligenerans pegani TaxID=2776917 RepID=A0ABR9MS08_9MICO|nr:hypothetical protein [Myceligenerans sp. TRM 65318]MBE1874159.1 hypothetical protein [Myceligenerans sp. TRM 65318]MBE3016431.1 hypothetical protein [Myceligenerans sp. TRM 65318]